MTRITLEPTVLEKLTTLDEQLEICDESGRIVGYYRAAPREAIIKNGVPTSPYSDAEIEILRQQRTGRPISEILEELRAS